MQSPNPTARRRSPRQRKPVPAALACSGDERGRPARFEIANELGGALVGPALGRDQAVEELESFPERGDRVLILHALAEEQHVGGLANLVLLLGLELGRTEIRERLDHAPVCV